MSPLFYDIPRLHLTVPIDVWQNSSPIFGGAFLCTTKIVNFRRQPQNGDDPKYQNDH